MDAELIVIGSELLQPGSPDANSPWLVERLNRIGIDVRQIGLVGDDEIRIAALVARALDRSQAVILSGGLGPTEDDRTRAALARALHMPLELDRDAAERLQQRWAELGRKADPLQLRQAERPRGAQWLDNPVGTAPGLRVEKDAALLFALPGVPAEMRAMFEASVEPLLRSRSSGALKLRRLRIVGRTESSVDQLVRDLYGTEGAEVTILAKPTGVELVLRVDGPTPQNAAARLEALDRDISARLGQDLFGRDDETLASVVGSALRTRSRTVATAESCTSGLLAAAITEVPGSSAWYRGGFVVYANDLKVKLVGVHPDTVEAHGAVSGPVASDLARGARDRCGADYGVGITGIAGPTGGDEVKPVGLVHVAVADKAGTDDHRFRLSGDRDLVRARAVALALDCLRRKIGELP